MEISKTHPGGTIAPASRAAATILRGIAGGLIAGVTVELFLFAVGYASWPGTYQWVASGAFGKIAYTSAAYAWAGVALHFVISAGWGVAFAALWSAWAPARRNAPVTGAAFGFAVFLAMQLVAYLGHIWAPPTATGLALYVIDHVVFFGVPLALYVARSAARDSAR